MRILLDIGLSSRFHADILRVMIRDISVRYMMACGQNYVKSILMRILLIVHIRRRLDLNPTITKDIAAEELAVREGNQSAVTVILNAWHIVAGEDTCFCLKKRLVL